MTTILCTHFPKRYAKLQACDNCYTTWWRHNTPAGIRRLETQETKRKEWRLAHPRLHKKTWWKENLKYRWGLSVEQYRGLRDGQDGRCAICLKKQRRFRRSFHIDHNHRTGQIRGLLCVNCNTGLGKFPDVLRLERAKQYLCSSGTQFYVKK